MANDALMWLQEWYFGQCDGDWEHQYGVEVRTLDNPGWRVEIDLVGTALEGVPFSSKRVERTEVDWIACEVSKGKFSAACGPRNLGEAIEVFRTWVAEQGFEQRKRQRLGG